MIKNQLNQIEKNLRYIAKRNKGITFSIGLALMYLMLGVNAFSEEVNSVASKQEISRSTDKLSEVLRDIKAENEKKLKGANLELVQLMEQGEQVVKSPWSSWQFGMNYIYESWGGAYKGKGDKKQKYPYEGIFTRYEAGTEQEMYRYVTSALSPEMYQHVPKSSDSRAASTSSRDGLTSSYGLASTTVVPKKPISIELNASIKPRDVGKKSPTSVPQAPNIVLPAFEPRLITPPVAPSSPNKPTLTFPSFSLTAQSNGNGGRTLADMSNNSNGAIESVILTSGNFNISRKTDSKMDYSYNNYSGISPWKAPSTDSGNTFIGGNKWTNWSRVGATTGSWLGFQKLVGDGSGTGAMLSNSSNLFTNVSTSTLREFVHLDHHSDAAPAAILTGFNAGLAESTWDSTVSSGSNQTAVIGAFEDLRDNINSTTAHGTSAVAGSNMYIWMQSGRIVMEGSYNAVSNNYDHNGGVNKKSIAANVGDIVIQPHKNAANVYSGSKSAIFTLSPGGNNPGHLSIMYNGNTGNMDLWTTESAVFLNSETAGKPISIVNRGTINIYGEKSAGIYNSQMSKMNLQFVDTGFSFDATTNIATGNYKPINIYGDSSVGIYWDRGNTGSIEGNFAVNIGATGVGNKNFTTKSNSTVTGGAETNGVAISDYNVNPSDVATTNKDYIRGTFGILSNGATNLTSHQIKIFDRTQKNVGVMPSDNVLLNIGGGDITLEGGTTAKENIGVYIDSKGAVKSTGDINLKDGVGNLAIFAKGGNIPGGSTNNVEVRKVNATDTKNSIVIYAEAGAKVKADELNIAGAQIEADASTVNAKDSGAVYATGANTVVNIDRTAAPTTDNISITGTKLTDANRYVGFGLMAADGAVISAKKNKIKVTDGSTGVASTGANSNVDLTDGSVDYSGEGYALYVENNGKINMTNGILTLRGKAVGFEKDLGGGTPLITTTGMNINVFSNDVTVVSLKNAPNLNLNNLFNNLTGLVGIGSINNVEAGTTYGNYKLAAIDGLGAYNIDKNLDKKAAATGGVDTDADTFVKNLVVQRAKLNLLSGKNVEAHLNSSDLTALNESTVVGLAMNSSTSAVSNNETQINVQANSTVSADRTDSGSGAVGLFINYGEANIANGGALKVEKHTANAANDSAVGVYAVNGSLVNNSGDISVGGNKSIGVLGLSYRTDSGGALVKDEFGPLAVGQGKATVNNLGSGKIEMDGKEAVGIYVENNDTVPHDIYATNNGTINMSGEKSVGMAAKNFNGINNTGTININADQGVGMFGAVSGVVENSGTINAGDSSNENLIRIGMFTQDQNVRMVNSGTINAGKNSYAIYGKDVRLLPSSVLNIGDNGVGLFSKADTNNPLGNVQISAGATFNLGDNEAVGVFTENPSGGIVVEDSGSNMNIGKNSYGYVLKGKGTTFTNTNAGTVGLKESSVYLYSTDTKGSITNNAVLTSTGNSTYGLYSAGTVTNNANINFTTGIGNVGIYSTDGGRATNNAVISVGESDPSTDRYAIAMAAGFNGDGVKIPFTGNIVNEGTINVNSRSSIGMYGTGNATTVYNGTVPGSTARINLNADGAIGMYLDQGAKGYNYGTITTVGSPKGVVGVSVKNNAEFINHGTITINSSEGMAAFNDGGQLNLRNYGTINLSGGAIEQGSTALTPTATAAGGVEIDSPNGPATSPAVIKKDGVIVPIKPITTPKGQRKILSSGIGMYVDTLRGTNPINGLNTLAITKADLIIGSEAAKATNSKYIQVSGRILAPYIQTMKNNPQITDWNIYPASLTWLATVTRDNNGAGDVENIYLAKIPYTNWAGNEPSPVDRKDTYNFTNGLEQRYGVEELGTRENELFQKLNGIGNNEEILLYQAFDEMMGHQYANIQQRIHSTGQILDKEFDYLKDEWRTGSKDSNKIKVFGMKGEYSTDTAGIIDYKNNAYGVAYVGENETVKLGKSSGWYTGLVHNKFDFKDIGNSKEEMLQAKLGLFKSVAFDDNNSLNWTISGEAFAGYNKMHRKFLVVDEIFNARSKYWSYGLALKNELSKTFRLSEDFSLRGYGSIKAEYGRFQKIDEKSGEMRLEIKANDYISIKPEIGGELIYKTPLSGRNFFNAKLGVKYENELGRVANAKNKARVAHTNADWFNIRGEKEDRRGSVGADLSLGLDNERFGITASIGYDTKGKNKKAGLGIRIIF